MPITPISLETTINRTAPAARPALAVVDAETALLVWEQNGHIRGQRMTATGIKRGDELTISTSESSKVFSPAVAPVGAGRVFVVWLERPVEADGSAGLEVERGEVRGQLLDEAGAKVGPHLLIAENARFGDFHRPTIDSIIATEVDLAWIGDHPDDSRRTAPLVQRVGFEGFPPDRVTLVGEPFFATANRGGDVVSPHVAIQKEPRFGGIFITWFAGPTGFEDAPFRGQLFSFQDDGSLAPGPPPALEGRALAGEIELHDLVGNAHNIAIANLVGGRYIAAWLDRHGGLIGAILNPDGSRADLIGIGDVGQMPVLARLRFPSGPPGAGFPEFDAFVAAWVGNLEFGLGSPDEDVIVQAVSSDGSKSGAAHRANEARVGAQHDPTLAALSDGRFMLAWANHDFPAPPEAPSPSIRVRGFQFEL